MNENIASGTTSYVAAALAGIMSMDGQEWLLFFSVVLVIARLCIEIPRAIYALRKFFRGDKPDAS